MNSPLYPTLTKTMVDVALIILNLSTTISHFYALR